MIKVTQTRDKDGEHFVQPTLTFNDPLEAMVHLAKVELSWGAQIVDIRENKIEAQTRVMNCLDTSVFEGPPGEMRPLIELVYFYLKANENHSNLIVKKMVDYTQHLPNGIAGVPAFITMMAPFLIGKNQLKVAVMLACGVRNVDDIEIGITARIEDLVVAFQLSKDGLCSFREALTI